MISGNVLEVGCLVANIFAKYSVNGVRKHLADDPPKSLKRVASDLEGTIFEIIVTWST